MSLVSTASFLVSTGLDNEAKLKKIKSPVLFFHGSKDKKFGVKLSRALYEAVPTRKEFQEVAGATHGMVPATSPPEILGLESYWEKMAAFIQAGNCGI